MASGACKFNGMECGEKEKKKKKKKSTSALLQEVQGLLVAPGHFLVCKLR